MSLTSRLGTVQSSLSTFQLGLNPNQSSSLTKLTSELGISLLGLWELGGSLNRTFNTSSNTSLTLIQSARGFSGKKHLSQSITLTSTVNVTGMHKKSGSGALSFRQAASTIRLNIVHNTLTISQNATAILTKGATNHLTLSQAIVSHYAPHNGICIQNLSIAQSAVGLRYFIKNVSNTFVPVQTLTKLKLKTKNITQHLTIASMAHPERLGLVHSSLVLSQSITLKHIKHLTAFNILHLNNSITRSSSFVRAITQTLSFNSNYLKQMMIAGQLQYILLPNALVTKVVKNSISLRTTSRAIILRRPLLQDLETGLDKVILHRVTTGGTFTYARKTECKKLKYSFELDRNKALEFRRYVFDCMSDIMWLTNWKGELWVGYVANNPFEFTVTSRGLNGGEQYSVDLEFEGQKVQ